MTEELRVSTYSPPASVREGSHVSSMEVYDALYRESVQNPEGFWAERARKEIDWIRPFEKVCEGDLATGDVRWYEGGQLNVSVQCIDRHLANRARKTAILWEGDEPADVRSISYQELHDEVCRMANVLRQHGIGKGDRVALYMPMIPAHLKFLDHSFLVSLPSLTTSFNITTPLPALQPFSKGSYAFHSHPNPKRCTHRSSQRSPRRLRRHHGAAHRHL